jgi:exodeoxyribonuclease-5
MTLHRLLYDSMPRAAGGFYRKPKPKLDYTIIVVDEISMVPKTLVDLLFTHKVYVICLGDPGQLPPIDKNEDNHLLDHPHVFLEEIMRQAAESEIIQLTMKIRN